MVTRYPIQRDARHFRRRECLAGSRNSTDRNAFFVENIRTEVCAVWPDDGADVLQHSHLTKKRRSLERFKDSIKWKLCGDVDVTFFAAFKRKTKPCTSQVLHFDYI